MSDTVAFINIEMMQKSSYFDFFMRDFTYCKPNSHICLQSDFSFPS